MQEYYGVGKTKEDQGERKWKVKIKKGDKTRKKVAQEKEDKDQEELAHRLIHVYGMSFFSAHCDKTRGHS